MESFLQSIHTVGSYLAKSILVCRLWFRNNFSDMCLHASLFFHYQASLHSLSFKTFPKPEKLMIVNEISNSFSNDWIDSYSTKGPGSSHIFIHFYTEGSIKWRCIFFHRCSHSKILRMHQNIVRFRYFSERVYITRASVFLFSKIAMPG